MDTPLRSPWQAAPWIAATLGVASARASDWRHKERSSSPWHFNDTSWAANTTASPFSIEWSDLCLGRRMLHCSCVEQWFALRKAWRFHDDAMMRTVMNHEGSTSDFRAMGRQVRGFDQEVWSGHSPNFTSGACLYYMMEALLLKFTQNPDLADRLRATGNQSLVYDSPDPVWGIGSDGTGENHLGYLLMDVRKVLTWLDSAFNMKYGNVLAFLPKLETADMAAMHTFLQPPSPKPGVISMGMMTYTPLIDDLNNAIQSIPWTQSYLELLRERGITPTIHPENLDCSQLDDAEVQALLMFIMRQERFADGLIADALDNGMITVLLRQLAQLKDCPLDVPLP